MTETLTVTIPLTDKVYAPPTLAAALRQAASEIQAGHGNGTIWSLRDERIGTWDIAAPQPPDALVTRLERVIELLNRYGKAMNGDQWWPGNASAWLSGPDGAELEALLNG